MERHILGNMVEWDIYVEVVSIPGATGAQESDCDLDKQQPGGSRVLLHAVYTLPAWPNNFYIEEECSEGCWQFMRSKLSSVWYPPTAQSSRRLSSLHGHICAISFTYCALCSTSGTFLQSYMTQHHMHHIIHLESLCPFVHITLFLTI